MHERDTYLVKERTELHVYKASITVNGFARKIEANTLNLQRIERLIEVPISRDTVAHTVLVPLVPIVLGTTGNWK